MILWGWLIVWYSVSVHLYTRGIGKRNVNYVWGKITVVWNILSCVQVEGNWSMCDSDSFYQVSFRDSHISHSCTEISLSSFVSQISSFFFGLQSTLESWSHLYSQSNRVMTGLHRATQTYWFDSRWIRLTSQQSCTWFPPNSTWPNSKITLQSKNYRQAERVGVVPPGETKAPRGSWSTFRYLKGTTRKLGRDFCRGIEGQDKGNRFKLKVAGLD